MEFCMFHEFPSLEGRSQTEAFDEAFVQIDRLGLAGILAEVNCDGTIPNTQVIEALRLLCREVKPQLP